MLLPSGTICPFLPNVSPRIIWNSCARAKLIVQHMVPEMDISHGRREHSSTATGNAYVSTRAPLDRECEHNLHTETP